MSETLSRREILRKERRRQILDAALLVFVENGFNAAKVSDVASRAGVSQGTIYWYFESKDELLASAVLESMDQVSHDAEAAVSGAITASEKLLAMADFFGGQTDALTGLFTLLLEYWASSPHREEASQLWSGPLGQVREVVVSAIEDGVKAGEFVNVDAEALSMALLAATDGLAAYAMLVPGFDLRRSMRALVETLLAGLVRPQESARTTERQAAAE